MGEVVVSGGDVATLLFGFPDIFRGSFGLGSEDRPCTGGGPAATAPRKGDPGYDRVPPLPDPSRGSCSPTLGPSWSVRLSTPDDEDKVGDGSRCG